MIVPCTSRQFACIGGAVAEGRRIMPSDNLPTIWEATPHTIAKIAILKAYLVAWFQILGITMQGKDLTYIDGFAGPGKYTNHPEGSPLAAITAALTARSNSYRRWRAGTIHCAFIEVDQGRYDNLTSKIAPYSGRPGLQLHAVRATFVEGIAQLKGQLSAFDQETPLFVFIDPFGATGVPFSFVADILSHPTSEVLVNLDADGIARIMRASTNSANARILDAIFGDNSWRAIRKRGMEFRRECRAVLDLYQAKLRALPDVSYTFPFEMRSHDGTLNYFLVFASQHPLGLEKMKEAMHQVDDSGSYCFSDAHSGEERLFRFDHPEDYTGQMFDAFRGQTVPYSNVRDYTLNETPFINPKGLLKKLEEQGYIAVLGTGRGRHRGTFPDDHLDTITIAFHDIGTPQALPLFPDMV